jgi:hypothetical protein
MIQIERVRPVTLGDLDTDDRIGDALADYLLACIRGECLALAKTDKRPSAALGGVRKDTTSVPALIEGTIRALHSWPPPPEKLYQERLSAAKSNAQDRKPPTERNQNGRTSSSAR